MKALSVRQPWAWLIVQGFKPIDNREWPSKYRGNLLIHASKGMTKTEYAEAAAFAKARGVTVPPMEDLKRGGIVGVVEMTGCVTRSKSPWFVGRYGHVFQNPYPLPFSPMLGQLGYFEPPKP